MVTGRFMIYKLIKKHEFCDLIFLLQSIFIMFEDFLRLRITTVDSISLDALTPFDYLKAKKILGAKTAQKQHRHRLTVQIPHRVSNSFSKILLKILYD